MIGQRDTDFHHPDLQPQPRNQPSDDGGSFFLNYGPLPVPSSPSLPIPFPFPSPPSLPLPFRPFSLPSFPSPPLSRPPPGGPNPLTAAKGLGERLSSPSVSGRSLAAKRFLVHFELKGAILVLAI